MEKKEYESLIKQLVIAKLEHVMSGKQLTFGAEEYACLKKMIAENPMLKEDSGYGDEDGQGNYARGAIYDEYHKRDDEGDIVGTKTELIEEGISIMILGNYLNVVYDAREENAVVSFGPECGTLKYGERPTNFTREEDFFDGMSVDWEEYTLEELEAKVTDIRNTNPSLRGLFGTISKTNQNRTDINAETTSINPKYDELLRQIVAQKLELAIAGNKFELDINEYQCFKTMIAENPMLVEDMSLGSEENQGNYVRGASMDEYTKKDELGRVVGTKYELVEEGYSIMVLGNYLNVHYDKFRNSAEVSLGPECGTLKYGERPTNFINPEDFLSGLQVVASELSLEQLEEMKKAFTKNAMTHSIQSNDEPAHATTEHETTDAEEIVLLASSKKELESERGKAQRLLKDFEGLENIKTSKKNIDI